MPLAGEVGHECRQRRRLDRRVPAADRAARTHVDPTRAGLKPLVDLPAEKYVTPRQEHPCRGRDGPEVESHRGSALMVSVGGQVGVTDEDAASARDLPGSRARRRVTHSNHRPPARRTACSRPSGRLARPASHSSLLLFVLGTDPSRRRPDRCVSRSPLGFSLDVVNLVHRTDREPSAWNMTRLRRDVRWPYKADPQRCSTRTGRGGRPKATGS